MKKILLMLSLITICINGYSQLEKGNMMIGGSVNYYASSNKMHNNTTFKQSSSRFYIRGGYFLSNKFVLGIAGGHSKSTFKRNNSTSIIPPYKQTYNSISASIGIFGRYYLMMNESKFGYFGQFTSDYFFGKGNSHFMSGAYDEKRTTKTAGFQIELSPGIVYFVTNRIGLDAQIGNISFYTGTSKTTTVPFVGSTDIEKNTAFTSNLSLSSINFGMHYYFGCKKTEK